jgi:DNA repair ATPase RecN
MTIPMKSAVCQSLAYVEIPSLTARHQDRWATEVDQLRQAVKNQPKYAAEIRNLQEQVLRLTVELHAARRILADRP